MRLKVFYFEGHTVDTSVVRSACASWRDDCREGLQLPGAAHPWPRGNGGHEGGGVRGGGGPGARPHSAGRERAETGRAGGQDSCHDGQRRLLLQARSRRKYLALSAGCGNHALSFSLTFFLSHFLYLSLCLSHSSGASFLKPDISYVILQYMEIYVGKYNSTYATIYKHDACNLNAC